MIDPVRFPYGLAAASVVRRITAESVEARVAYERALGRRDTRDSRSVSIREPFAARELLTGLLW